MRLPAFRRGEGERGAQALTTAICGWVVAAPSSISRCHDFRCCSEALYLPCESRRVPIALRTALSLAGDGGLILSSRW